MTKGVVVSCHDRAHAQRFDLAFCNASARRLSAVKIEWSRSVVCHLAEKKLISYSQN
jgi:hypothetical protein